MLHGEIRVNDREIGSWSAVNKGKANKGPSECYLYECSVDIYDSERPRMDFEVFHWPDDGAAELASKVLHQYSLRGVR